MKATIDFDKALYQRLKVVAAQRGRTVRELVAEGVRYVLDAPPQPHAPLAERPERPAWFAALHKYANRAEGDHSMAAVRTSIAHGRARSERE
ncbi:MAG: hypothetical protein ACRENQ_04735 [Gemmatimonadaceae bacterium]